MKWESIVNDAAKHLQVYSSFFVYVLQVRIHLQNRHMLNFWKVRLFAHLSYNNMTDITVSVETVNWILRLHFKKLTWSKFRKKHCQHRKAIGEGKLV